MKLFEKLKVMTKRCKGSKVKNPDMKKDISEDKKMPLQSTFARA